eukprot:Opistho-2@89964
MSFFEPGAWVWLKANNQWVPGRIVENRGSDVVIENDNTQERSTHAVAALNHETCTPMHQTSIESIEDMAALSDLHEGAILHNIKIRYKKDKCYTFIGSILAAVNPYKKLDIYGKEVLTSYNKKVIGELPPHIYAIANEAYYSMWKMRQNQCVLISGESGAGKTESTKFILKYLSNLSSGPSVTEKQILESSPIMEAFGNAKTVYNNNSSRFGKFIAVAFSEAGHIEGAKMTDCILHTVVLFFGWSARGVVGTAPTTLT